MKSLTWRSNLAALLLGACIVGQPAAAQEANTRVVNGAQFGAWSVNCEALAVNETVCVLNQRLIRTSDQAFLAEFLAFNNAREPGAYLAARVPLGVHFPSGFSLRKEGSEDIIEMTWQSCSQDLCEALISLDPDMVEELSLAEGAIAGYRPRFGAEALVFQVNLQGLDQGLSALASAMDGVAKNVDAQEDTSEQ